jgi:hypothetical protein
LPEGERKAVSVDERRKALGKATRQARRQARDANRRTDAKSLWEKLKEQHDTTRKKLKGREGKYDLSLELHAPSGSVIRMANISYYADTYDALLVVGRDDTSGEECQAIVPVESFYVIFRVREASKPERKPVGFNAVGRPD